MERKQDNWETKQERHRRQGGDHLKMQLGVKAIISRLLQIIWLANKMWTKYPGNKLVLAVWRLENNENLSSSAYVVQTTAQQVISRRW